MVHCVVSNNFQPIFPIRCENITARNETRRLMSLDKKRQLQSQKKIHENLIEIEWSKLLNIDMDLFLWISNWSPFRNTFPFLKICSIFQIFLCRILPKYYWDWVKILEMPRSPLQVYYLPQWSRVFL